jgi:predicted nucleic acid-binding protein
MFNSSIYIAALRIRHDAALQLRRLAGGEPIWLSSVVLEQLYTGASVKHRHIVERCERDFDRAGRVLVPNLKDWAQAGKVLPLVAAESARQRPVDQRCFDCNARRPDRSNSHHGECSRF